MQKQITFMVLLLAVLPFTLTAQKLNHDAWRLVLSSELTYVPWLEEVKQAPEQLSTNLKTFESGSYELLGVNSSQFQTVIPLKMTYEYLGKPQLCNLSEVLPASSYPGTIDVSCIKQTSLPKKHQNNLAPSIQITF